MLYFCPSAWTTRADIGKAEIPAAPIRGLTFPPVRRHMSLPKRIPTAVSRPMAMSPRTRTMKVSTRRNFAASIVAPIQSPRRSVTIFVISFSEVLFSRSTTPDSFIRFPSMTIPISGVPRGATNEAATVTTMGKRILVVLETGCFTTPITIFRSFSVVSKRMIGGWMSGTRDM